MKKLSAILPVALIILAPMIMLYPLWSNPLSAGEDDVIYYYPLRKMVGQSLRAGRLPLHNPLEAGGAPVMADPQSAVMYPPTWLFAAMSPKLAYSFSIFLAFSLAGAGMYLYLRRVGLMPPAATFGAVAMMFCGYMVAHRVHLSMIHTAAYLPWGLWCIERLRDRPFSAFGWMAPVAFLAITAGHWPTLIYVGLILFVYLLLRGRPFIRSLAVSACALILAAAVAWPQIAATADLLAQATRCRIGYVTATENSFYPLASVLAFFPMLMGLRTPNFFPQPWWGAWHFCEMLGYVGLVTLALAAAAVWRLYRKKKSTNYQAEQAAPDTEGTHLRKIVRIWTWIVVGAGLWMLGGYLPTYRLIHSLPVLGVIRCPARMVLAAGLGLAVLASIAIDVISRGEGKARMSLTARRMAGIVLPVLMLLALLAVYIFGRVMLEHWPDKIPFMAGGAKDILAAVRPGNPAVWLQVAILIITITAIRFWLKSPRRRAVCLVAVLLVDLFFISRFVDAPAGEPAEANVSPAARWLAVNAPPDEPYRVYGLSRDYFHRPAELLLPKTCSTLGIASIVGYGPFQSPVHARLLGFSVAGVNRDWADMIRRNHLLSLYGVRYILAADTGFRRVIESVTVPTAPAEPDGRNLLGGDWLLQKSEKAGPLLRLQAKLLSGRSMASRPVSVEADTIYRIALDVRSGGGGAAAMLRAELFRRLDGWAEYRPDELGLSVAPEQVVPQWRHFEWTFRTPETMPPNLLFRLWTRSERAIEVRNLSLRRSIWPPPVAHEDRLAPGEHVYRKLVELPALDPSDPPVAIYENRLCRPIQLAGSGRAAVTVGQIEALRWPKQSDRASMPETAPPIGMADSGSSAVDKPRLMFLAAVVPAVMLYGLAVAVGLFRARRRDE